MFEIIQITVHKDISSICFDIEPEQTNDIEASRKTYASLLDTDPVKIHFTYRWLE